MVIFVVDLVNETALCNGRKKNVCDQTNEFPISIYANVDDTILQIGTVKVTETCTQTFADRVRRRKPQNYLFYY